MSLGDYIFFGVIISMFILAMICGYFSVKGNEYEED